MRSGGLGVPGADGTPGAGATAIPDPARPEAATIGPVARERAADRVMGSRIEKVEGK